MHGRRINILHVVGSGELVKTGDIDVIGAGMDVTTRKLTEIELRGARSI